MGMDKYLSRQLKDVGLLAIRPPSFRGVPLSSLENPRVLYGLGFRGFRVSSFITVLGPIGFYGDLT